MRLPFKSGTALAGLLLAAWVSGAESPTQGKASKPAIAAATPASPGAPSPAAIEPPSIASGARRFGPPRRAEGVLPPVLLNLDSVRLAVMEPNGVFPGDLDLYPPNARADRYRLARVMSVLRNPFRLEGVVDEVLARSEPYTSVGKPLPVPPDFLWPLLDAEPFAWPEQLPGLPGSPDSALARIRAGLADHMAALGPAERDFLFKEASSLFLEEEEDTTLLPVEGELKRLREEARAHRILELAGRLHRPGLVRAASAAWGLQAWILDSLRAPDTTGHRAFLARLKALAAKAKVPVRIGTKGPDRHRPDRGIWIDPGGDDQWDMAPRARPGEFLLIIDLAGNDLYRSNDSLSRSPGNLGVNLLADLGGNDHYLGSNYAFGSALFGYSHLFDAAGHDYYEGRCASLAFAAFGLGVLQDEAGSDTYSASLLSQGASSTWGLGLLLDRGGDDRYMARPTFKDDLRYNDRYIHMVQGFSTGLAPDYSGGIGILRDQGGNDVYLADIYGQGSGYWYAMGLLLDESGDDRYEAHQYAQGAGVHIAVGAAVDWAGNDHRASKGVSQGCGHDLGLGLLHDRAGDDNYLGTDKVQGSGSANGLGILHDQGGKDFYTSINPKMALGDADMRRDRGSFGFFLDGGGQDAYTAHVDNESWRTFDGVSKGNGYGLDQADDLPSMPLQAPAPAEALPPPPVTEPAVAAMSGADSAAKDSTAAARPLAAAQGDSLGPLPAPSKRPAVDGGAQLPVFSWQPPVLTSQDSLFLVAATGEPRFKPLRDSAEKRLREAGAQTLEYLAARRLTGQTPRQRHYVERLFTVISDSGRRKEPLLQLEAALKAAPDSVRVQLLRIGSAMGDSNFLPVARTWLDADSVEVRRMAVRALGSHPRASDVRLLLDGLEKTEGLEKQMRLWALSQHRRLEEWKAVLPILKDPKQYNRQWARRIVARGAFMDWSGLEKLAPTVLPKDTTRMDERLEWALLASEMPGHRSRDYLEKAIPLLEPRQRVFYRGLSGKFPKKVR
jgi:hypothetical protein